MIEHAIKSEEGRITLALYMDMFRKQRCRRCWHDRLEEPVLEAILLTAGGFGVFCLVVGAAWVFKAIFN
jgi:hypothetical protein